MKNILLFIILYYWIHQKGFVVGSRMLIKSLEQDDSLLEYLDQSGLRQVKYNKTAVGLMSGKIKIFKSYPTAKVNLRLAMKMGNGYIPMSMLDMRNSGYCEMFDNPIARASFLDDLYAHYTLPYNCNHEPGEYELTYYAPMAPPNMPTGEYRAEMEMLVDDKFISKYKVYFVVK